MTDAELMRAAFESCSPKPKTKPTSRKKGKAPSRPSRPSQSDNDAFKAAVRTGHWAALKGVK